MLPRAFAPLLLTALLAGRAHPEEDPALRRLVERYFAAYAQKDLDGFMSLWSATAPGLAQRRDGMKAIFAETGPIEARGLTIHTVQRDGDRARIRVGLVMAGSDVKTGKPYEAFGKLERTLHLVREKEEWKVVRYVPTATEVAIRLIDARDARARGQVLDEEKKYLDPALLEAVFREGTAATQEGRFAEAARAADAAFDLAQVLKDEDGIGWALVQQGTVHLVQNRAVEALAPLQKGLAALRKGRHQGRLGAALLITAAALAARDDMAGAAALYQECAGVMRATGERRLEAVARQKAGGFLAAIKKTREARTELDAARLLFQQLADTREEIRVILLLALLTSMEGKDAEALPLYEVALEKATPLKDAELQAEAIGGRALIEESLGRLDQARADYVRALGLTTSRPVAHLRWLKLLASLERKLGRRAEAQKLLEQGLRLARLTRSVADEQSILRDLGSLLAARGQLEEAARMLEASLALARDRLASPPAEAHVLRGLAELRQSQGRLGDALDLLEKSIALFEKSGDPVGLGLARLLRGDLLCSLGRYPAALAEYDTLIALARRLGLRREEALYLMEQARVHDARGDVARAETTLAAALRLAAQEKDVQTQTNIHNNHGVLLLEAGQPDRALESFQAMLTLAQKGRDGPLHALALRQIAGVHSARGEDALAGKHLGESLERFEALGDVAEQARTLSLLARHHQQAGAHDRAEPTYRQALALASRVGDPVLEAHVRYDLGKYLAEIGRTDLALAELETARQAHRKAGVRRSEVLAILRLADAQRSTSRFQEAEALLEEARGLAREMGSERLEMLVRLSLAQLWLEQGRLKEARQARSDVLAYAQRGGQPLLEVNARLELAQVLQEMGLPDGAASHIRAGLAVARRQKLAEQERVGQQQLARLHLHRGEYDEARTIYTRQLEQARRQGDLTRALLLQHLGVLDQSEGKLGEGLRRFEESLALYQKLGSGAGEATTRFQMAHMYLRTGQPAQARYQLERCLDLFRRLGMVARQAEAEVQLAQVLLLQGDGKRCGEVLGQLTASLPALGRRGDLRSLATILMDLGKLLYVFGVGTDTGAITGIKADHARTLDTFTRCRKLFHDLGDRVNEAAALANVGRTQLAMGKPEEALATFREALALHRQVPTGPAEFLIQEGMASAFRASRRWREAADAYRKAITRLEQLRADAREQTLQLGLLSVHGSSHVSPYFALATCLMELRQLPEQAFAVSEQGKARVLVDLLAGGKVRLAHLMTPEEWRQEDAHTRALNALERQYQALARAGTLSQEQNIELTSRIEKTRLEADSLRRRLYLAHPRLQAARGEFAALSLGELGSSLFADHPDLAVISYLVGEQETLLFVLSAGPRPDEPARLDVHRIEVARRDLEQEIAAFRKYCLDYRDTTGFDTEKLHRWLIAPAEERLAGKKHLVLSPDGPLHTLPFQALRDGEDTYLIEKLSLSYAPSVTALVKMLERGKERRQQARAGRLVAIGAPLFGPEWKELPSSEREVDEIVRKVGGEPLVLKREQATRQAVLQAIPGGRLIHFATHADLKEDAPMYSAIVLTPDRKAGDNGLLRARELAELSLSADLVVLSACQTGLGKQTAGEGVLGLAWSLFAAGSPGSVVSLWSVNDASTSDLMVSFYAALPATTGAEALRQAQLAMLKDRRRRHPYFWAPFVLVGSWQR